MTRIMFFTLCFALAARRVLPEESTKLAENGGYVTQLDTPCDTNWGLQRSPFLKMGELDQLKYPKALRGNQFRSKRASVWSEQIRHAANDMDLEDKPASTRYILDWNSNGIHRVEDFPDYVEVTLFCHVYLVKIYPSQK